MVVAAGVAPNPPSVNPGLDVAGAPKPPPRENPVVPEIQKSGPPSVIKGNVALHYSEYINFPANFVKKSLQL